MEDFYKKIYERINNWLNSKKIFPEVDYSRIKKVNFVVNGLDEKEKVVTLVATEEDISDKTYLGTYDFATFTKWSIHSDYYLVEFTESWFIPFEELNLKNHYFWLDVFVYSLREKADTGESVIYPPIRKDHKLVCSLKVVPHSISKLIDADYKVNKLKGIGSKKFKQSVFGQFKNIIILADSFKEKDISFQIRFMLYKYKIDTSKKNYAYLLNYIKKLIPTFQSSIYKMRDSDLVETAHDILIYLENKIRDSIFPYSIKNYLKKIAKIKVMNFIRSMYPNCNDKFPISIITASQKLNTYPEHLYRLIKKGVIEPYKDSSEIKEYLEIDEVNFKIAEKHINEKQKLKSLRNFISEKKQISRHSAKKFINYRLKKGETIEQIVNKFIKNK